MLIFRMFIMVSLTMIIACQSNHSTSPVEPLPPKPDLIIDTVSYNRLPSCQQGYPSGIICGPPTFGFSLRIKNIGSADCNSSFMIDNSRSKWDFDNKYLSYGQIANYPAVLIPVNGTLNINITSDVNDSVTSIFMVINPDSSYNIRHVSSLVDEQNYANNSYVVSLKW